MSRHRRTRSFPGEGELDENGNTPCMGCGTLVPVWEDYAIWEVQMQEQYPDEPIETLEEMVADCKCLCEDCGSAL